MRITGWHIEAFGALHDVGVRGLPGGLVVLHGPNASGKSTLLAFLQRTLFGYPHGGLRGVNHYRPADGGDRRGRVYLEADGPVIVERASGRGRALNVTLPDETVGGEDALRRLTGGCDAQLFRAVYAFGLDELTSLSSLEDEAVRDRLFSAGIAGAGRSARAAVAGLQSRLDALWTPQSRTREIDGLIDALAAVDADLARAQRAAHDYPERRAAEDAAAAFVARLDAEADRAEAARREADALLAAWPAWVRRERAAAQLADIGELPALPRDGVERLQGLSERLAAAEERLGEIADERAALARRRDAAPVDDALASRAQEVRALAADASVQRARLERLDELDRQAARSTEALEATLSNLGAGWDRERLDAFDASVAVRGELRQWAEDLEAADRSAEDAEQANAAVSVRAGHDRDAAERAQQAVDDFLVAQSKPIPSEATLDARAQALTDLRIAVAERDTADAELAASERARAVVQRGARLSARAALAAGIVAGLAGGFAAWHWWEGLPELAVGAGVAAVAAALAALGIIIVRARGRAARRSPAFLGMDAAQERRKAAAERVIEHAGALALPSDVRVGTLERAAQAIDRGYRDRAELTRLVDNAESTRAAAERSAAELEAVSARAEVAGRVRDGLRASWQRWCRERGLDATRTPTGTLDVFDLVAQGRGHRDRLAELDGERTALSAALAAYTERAAAVVDGEGQPPALSDRAALAAQVEELGRLAAAVDSDEANRQVRASLDEQDRSLAGEAARLSQRVQAARAERDGLLVAAGVVDLEGYRDLVERSARRASVEEQWREADAALASQIGSGTSAEQVLAALSSGEKTQWETQRRVARARGQELAEARDEALARLHDARRIREEVERSADVAELAGQRAALLADLEALGAQWQVHALARDLITETVAGFERDRQPAVLRRAAEHLSLVTAGSYTRVLQRGEELVVLDAGGRTWPVELLSRGSAEQLYLSLRLALAEDFAARDRPLPFVMDDVIVNFDPERAGQLARLLTSVAEAHQILYFTCHPHTVEVLARAGASVYDLDGRGRPLRREAADGR